MVDLDLHFVESGEHVLTRVLSATNEEDWSKGDNPIKLLTDGVKPINQSSYLEKADITGGSVNGEDAIDVDDNDGKLTKSSNASDQVSETIVSVHYGYKTFLWFPVMREKLFMSVNMSELCIIYQI